MPRYKEKPWLKALARERGVKLIDMAAALGISHARISEVIGGRRQIQPNEYRPLASILKLSVEELHNLSAEDDSKGAPNITQTPQNRQEFDTMRLAATNISTHDWIRDIPVRGTAAGSSEGSFQMTGEVTEYLKRPHALQNKSVYGLYIENDSMEPRYMPGEVVFVDENRPPAPGDHVIVQTTENGHDVQAMCKKLVRRSASVVVLSQYNPEMEIRIDPSKIIAIHRIIPWTEVHGF